MKVLKVLEASKKTTVILGFTGTKEVKPVTRSKVK